MNITRITSAALVVLSLAACAEAQNNPKRSLGALVGAGLGALAGSQIGGGTGRLAAVAVGTLGGAYLGSEVGRSLDRADRARVDRAARNALEYNRTGQTVRWRNPDSGHSGTFTPTRTYQTAGGRNCREYQTTVTVGGRNRDAYGTACRQGDGTWKINQ
jgi:surface antigen